MLTDLQGNNKNNDRFQVVPVGLLVKKWAHRFEQRSKRDSGRDARPMKAPRKDIQGSHNGARRPFFGDIVKVLVPNESSKVTD